MKKKKMRLASASLAIVLGVTTMFTGKAAFHPMEVQAAASDTNDDWLHTERANIVDKDGKVVRLTGANWFGFNCCERILHGLGWGVNMYKVLGECADRGINLLRIPVSTQLLLEWKNGEAKIPDTPFNADGFNLELVHENGQCFNNLEVFDALLSMCKEYGIKVMVDVHSAEANNAGHTHPMWYNDGAGITTEDWIEGWVWLVDRYKDDDTLIACDLENEPHGKVDEGDYAKWDDSDSKLNWKKAAEDCANAILKVNPNILIMVEGVEMNPIEGKTYDDDPGKDWANGGNYFNFEGAWWGGNLRMAKRYPISLEKAEWNKQVVYSPHDYGPKVWEQTWFEKDFTEQTLLADYWYDAWAYLVEEDRAPLLMGEWGGFMDGGDNEKWMNLIADYMNKKNMSHTFWCLNPNSGDTGGLLNDDWKTWDEEKYKLFERTLWQDVDGKYVSLDHQKGLGKDGITIGEYYANPKNPVYDSSSGNTSGGSSDPSKETSDPSKGTSTPSKEPSQTPSGDKPVETPSKEGSSASPSKENPSGKVYATGFELGVTTLTMTVKEERPLTDLQPIFTPANTTNQDLEWKTSDQKIVRIQNGDFIADRAGIAQLTATTKDGGFQARCRITVQKDTSGENPTLSKIIVSPAKIELGVGGSIQLKASVTPSTSQQGKIIWSSSDPDAVSVGEDGTIKALKGGTTVTITASNEDGTVTGTSTVTVRKAQEPSEGQTTSTPSEENKPTAAPSGVAEPSDFKPSSAQPSGGSSVAPSKEEKPSDQPSMSPSKEEKPTLVPSDNGQPSKEPSKEEKPSMLPSKEDKPTAAPSKEEEPSAIPSKDETPSVVPSKGEKPTTEPSRVSQPTSEPSKEEQPSVAPSKSDGDEKIPVTGVRLNETSVRITRGETFSLIAQIQPLNASNQACTWKVEDPSVATVDSKGVVNAKEEGVTAVTVTTQDGGYKATCIVQVEEPKGIAVSKVTLDETVLVLTKGETKKLTKTIEPENAKNQNVSWESDAPSIVKVAADGTVVAVEVGQANVTVKTQDGGKTASCVVIVKEAETPDLPVAAEKIWVEDTKVELAIGKTKFLEPEVLPDNATNKKVYFKSLNGKVATIQNADDYNAMIKAKAPGITKIVITSQENSKIKKEITVTVKPNKVTSLKKSSTKKNSVKLSWKKVSGVTGYEIYQGSKRIKAECKTTSYTVKKLKKNTSYKFKVRAYKKVGSKKVYGSYSMTLKVKTKKS